MFPFSMYQDKEKVEEVKKGKAPSISKFKEIVQDVILKGVVSPKISLVKKEKELCIQDIMETEVLYNALFTAIFLHTFGKLKKKLISREFKSVEKLAL